MMRSSSIAVSILVLASLASGASADLLRVPYDYPTIPAACAAADSGDTVGVYAGDYYQAYARVAPGVSVIGMEEDSTLVKVFSSSGSAPFSGQAGNAGALLENMEIHGGLADGVVQNMNPNLVIQRCYLHHESEEQCISPLIETSADLQVKRCHIYYNGGSFAFLFAPFWNPVHALLEDCVVSWHPSAWVATEGSILEIKNNTFLTGCDVYIPGGDMTDFSLFFVNNIFPSAYCAQHSWLLPDTLEWRYNDFINSAPDPDCGYQVGNFSADPMFCDPDAGDYRLQWGSPCYGTGEGGEDVGARLGYCWPAGIEERCPDGRASLRISGPWPNPTMTGVSLRLDGPARGRARMSVVDICGNLLGTLPDVRLGPDVRIRWDGRLADGRLAESGVYYLKLQYDRGHVSKCVTIVR